LTHEDCPILAVAHGTDLDKAKRIIVSGFATLSIIDAGYYGKGMYFTTSAIYTVPYFISKPNPSILICFILPGNPYPVIENPKQAGNIVGQPIMTGYHCNYVVTRKDGLPLTEYNYLNENKLYYNEIVLGDESQVVPIFLILLNNSNFSILSQEYQREIVMENSKPPNQKPETVPLINLTELTVD